VSGSLYQVRAYNVNHSCDVSGFLEAYRCMLQKAVDEVWGRIRWVERRQKNYYLVRQKGKKKIKKCYYVKRLIPRIPSEGSFKHHYLRNLLLKEWNYSKHYVDSAIKQAYSILKSWRKNYLKGRRSRRKPKVKKRFVRIKETLYSYRNGKIRVSIKPYEEYLEFDISKAWFWSRVPKDAEMGELILNKKHLTITFRFKQAKAEPKDMIAWDCNEKSLDGFNPKIGWIKIDLTGLFHTHRVYELKRKRLQSLASKKPSLRRILTKYSNREKNKVRDFLHKLTTFLAKEFKEHIHGFESLKKETMFNRSKTHNRNVAKSDWKTTVMLMSYKSSIKFLNPHNSTKECSRCGELNEALKGASYKCKFCGLKINRQLNASINLYLQMEGLSPSPKLFDELMKGWSGFTQTGEKANEDSNEPKRSPRLMNPKRNIPAVMFRYVSQNPFPKIFGSSKT